MRKKNIMNNLRKELCKYAFIDNSYGYFLILSSKTYFKFIPTIKYKYNIKITYYILECSKCLTGLLNCFNFKEFNILWYKVSKCFKNIILGFKTGKYILMVVDINNKFYVGYFIMGILIILKMIW